MAFLDFLRLGTGRLCAAMALACAIGSLGCGHNIVQQTHAATVSPAPGEATEPAIPKQVRATGTIEAIHSLYCPNAANRRTRRRTHLDRARAERRESVRRRYPRRV